MITVVSMLKMPACYRLHCSRRGPFFPALLLFLCATGCQTAGLARDDHVIFFSTPAHSDGQGGWVVPINGWVSEPRLSDWQYRVMKRRFDLDEFVETPEERAILRERVDRFIVDNKSGREIDIVVGGRQVRLAQSSEMGVIDDHVVVPGDAALAAARSRWLTYRTVARRNRQAFQGSVQLLEPTGLSVVSDIDDTIRITEVKNTKAMIQRNFLKPFEVVPGKPELYRHWKESYGAEFHYISAAPHQLYEPMAEMIEQNFPRGSTTMRSVKRDGSTMRYLLDLLDAPKEHKLEEIGRLLTNFPRRDFVLIGDSADSDPEVYARLARIYPTQIRRILIRDVTCEDAGSPRYQETFAGLPSSLWQIYTDPEEIWSAIEPDGDRASTAGVLQSPDAG